MATAHYRNRYSDCPICSCSQFDAGFIDERLKAEHWPEDAWKPDFQAMQQELEERFGLTVSEDDIEEHWELHVTHRMTEYRKWAEDKMEHSACEDPHEAGWPKHE